MKDLKWVSPLASAVALLLIFLLLSSVAFSQTATTSLSENEKRYLEGVGITRVQIDALSPSDQAGLKQVIAPLIKDAAPRVRSYIITRAYVVKAKSDPTAVRPPEFDFHYVTDAEKAALSSQSFSPQEYAVIEAAGSSHSDKLITELNAQEQTKLKQIIKNKPSAVKAYLMTRYVLRKTKGRDAKELDTLFSKDDVAAMKYVDMDYTNTFDEQLQLYNVLLYYGIDAGTKQEQSK